MSEKLHKILADLGDTINQEILNAPAPALDILDRSISGNKINGGKIANFASTGIKDNATYAGEPILTVENDKIVAEAPIRGVAKPPTLDSLGILECEN